MDTKSIFEILIRENTDMLIAYLRSSVRDNHMVDDLYQEIILTAWRRLESYDRQRPFGPWLRGIASNMILCYYRKASRNELQIDSESLEWLDSKFDAIRIRSGDTLAEKLSSLRVCIGELPDTYQYPIKLRYLEQMSHQQVASKLRITIDTLKKRITRGKSRLASCLERKLNSGVQESKS